MIKAGSIGHAHMRLFGCKTCVHTHSISLHTTCWCALPALLNCFGSTHECSPQLRLCCQLLLPQGLQLHLPLCLHLLKVSPQLRHLPGWQTNVFVKSKRNCCVRFARCGNVCRRQAQHATAHPKLCNSPDCLAWCVPSGCSTRTHLLPCLCVLLPLPLQHPHERVVLLLQLLRLLLCQYQRVAAPTVPLPAV